MFFCMCCVMFCSSSFCHHYRCNDLRKFAKREHNNKMVKSQPPNGCERTTEYYVHMIGMCAEYGWGRKVYNTVVFECNVTDFGVKWGCQIQQFYNYVYNMVLILLQTKDIILHTFLLFQIYFVCVEKLFIYKMYK